MVKLSALGANQGVSASLDGRYLSLGNGQVAVVRNGAPLAGYPAKVPLSSLIIPAWPDSFANHDRDLIMLASSGRSYSADNPVSVVSIASGMSRSLGVADSAEGDPEAAGAFVSVAAGLVPSANVQQVCPDSRVERRDTGRPAVVLATARELDRELGLARNFAVALSAYPDPAGDKIAVEVSPISGSAAGIVVLDRTAASSAPPGRRSVCMGSPPGRLPARRWLTPAPVITGRECSSGDRRSERKQAASPDRFGRRRFRRVRVVAGWEVAALRHRRARSAVLGSCPRVGWRRGGARERTRSASGLAGGRGWQVSPLMAALRGPAHRRGSVLLILAEGSSPLRLPPPGRCTTRRRRHRFCTIPCTAAVCSTAASRQPERAS